MLFNITACQKKMQWGEKVTITRPSWKETGLCVHKTKFFLDWEITANILRNVLTEGISFRGNSILYAACLHIKHKMFIEIFPVEQKVDVTKWSGHSPHNAL